MAKRSKRIRSCYEGVDLLKSYDLAEAVKLLQTVKKTKFDETIDISVKLGVDPRQSDQNIRGMISLPHGTGKKVRVAVFAKGESAEAAKKAGADIVGDEDLAEKVQKGDMDFDRCIATPDMMVLVGKVGKILGPRGLMPNPKLGTVTKDVETAVKLAKSGQIEYRVERAGIVHAGLGKVSFDEKKIVENVKAFFDVLKKARPESMKGVFIKGVSLSSTMGPGLKIDLQSLDA